MKNVKLMPRIWQSISNKKLFKAKKKKIENYKYNIISKIDYYDEAKISINRPAADILIDHSALLIQRKRPATKNEIELQWAIERNHPRHYTLTERNLYRVEFHDDLKEVKSVRPENLRILGRMTPQDYSNLGMYRYIITINQRCRILEILRSLSPNSIAIAIFTPDFELSAAHCDLEFIDVLISPEIGPTFNSDNPIRSFKKAETIEECYLALTETFSEFAPKDFKILAPIFGSVSISNNINHNNDEEFDLVLILNADEKSLELEAGDFSSLVRNLVKKIRAILATEEFIYKYHSLVQGFPDSMESFVSLAMKDGARVDIRYEDDSTHF